MISDDRHSDSLVDRISYRFVKSIVWSSTIVIQDDRVDQSFSKSSWSYFGRLIDTFSYYYSRDVKHDMQWMF